MSVDENIVEFKCVPERCTYNSEDYKIYGASVDVKRYPDIKLNQYDNVTILGNMHDLGVGSIEYWVKAKEEQSKYGYQYKVLNIKRQKPTDIYSTKLFLSEILTYSQVEVLMEVYPDIIDRVMKNRLDDIDLSKTKGIKDYTFNVIKKKIIENFALVELVEEFKGLITLSLLKRLYDKYPSVKRMRIELKKDPYKCLCGLSGIGFKKADGLILEIDRLSKENMACGKKPIIDFGYDLQKSKQREKASIMFILEENEKCGHTRIDVKDLKNQSDKLTPSCKMHFIDIIKQDEDIYYDKPTLSVALTKTYDTEKYIANRILEGLQVNTEWDYDIEKYIEFDGIKLTDMQKEGLKVLCKNNIMILNGFGGTGKSQTSKAIINMLKANMKLFKLISPTGRAAKVLSEYSGEQATTIHRGLGYMPPDKWGYNEESKMFCDVLIVDEFSMTDIFLFRKILEAIDFNKTKLLLIGDSAQIPSVSAGNCLHDMINSKIVPVVTLDKVFRYGEGGLMTVATKTRNCEKFINDNETKVQIFGKDKSYVYIPMPQEKMINNLIPLYKKILSKGYTSQDILILSSFNVGNYGTIVINNKIQKVANKNFSNSNKIKIGETEYYKDDLVIQTINNYKAEIYDDGFDSFDCEERITFVPNGEIGRIVEVKKEALIIQFDNSLIKYDRSQLNQIKLAYAISTHKSQGGQCKVIILLTPKAHTYMLNSNLIYVGQTRAKEICYHMGEPVTINRAIKKKENFNRQTFLKNLLVNS